ncbi:hypothetical protein BGZ54_007750 [Gamsiella multidivaricata]|nr:hypothetical protein BGZ54_007750 [Gamsiella multidivaricata]
MPKRSAKQHSEQVLQEQHSTISSPPNPSKGEVPQSPPTPPNDFIPISNSSWDTASASEIQRGSSLAPSTTIPPRSKILVPDSGDEAEYDVVNARRKNCGSDEGPLELTCVKPYTAIPRPIASHTELAGQGKNESRSSNLFVQDVPDSEDEGLNLQVTDEPVLEHPENGGHDGSTQSIDILIDENMGIFEPRQSSTSFVDRVDHSTGHNESSTLAELPVNYQSQVYQPVIRSYPLRERTFQQRMPYTADKQLHARLIGSRGSGSSRHSLARDLSREDLALLDQQDDEEDPDYEDRGARDVHAVDGIDDPDVLDGPLRSMQRPHLKKIKDKRTMANMDFFLQDLDDDDLPTIEELRRRYLTPTHLDARKSATKDVNDSLLRVKLPPALSARAKQKLERLALQPLEPLDPVDAEPAIPYQMRFFSATPHHSTDEENEAGMPSPDGSMSGTPSRTDVANILQVDMAHDSFSDSDSEPLPSIKKTKKIRQHVLPMAFFKRNLLPDDAAALRSMRSKQACTRASAVETRAEPEQIQFAHHAKRRIASSGQDRGGALNDFIAQLAQDKSETEDESFRDLSPGSPDFDSDSHGDMWRSHPSLKDIVPSKSRSLSSEPYNHEYQKSLSLKDAGSSDSERQTSPKRQDPTDDRSRSTRESQAFQNPSSKGRPAFRAERLDMIDRMIVRGPHRSSKPKQSSSSITYSRKRRRVSRNLPSTKIRRSANGHIRNTPRSYSHLSEYSSADAQEVGSGSDSAVSDDFQDSAVNSQPRKRAGNDIRGYYRHQNRPLHERHNSDTDQDFFGDGYAFHDQEYQDSAGYIEHSLNQYDTTTPTHPPRRLCRPKVIPKLRVFKPMRPQQPHTRSKPNRATQSRPKVLRQRTIYSHLSSWHPQQPAPSRPQFVNKPFFEASPRKTRPHRDRDHSQHPGAGKATRQENTGDMEGDVPVDDYIMPDQPWSNEDGPGFEQTPLPESLPIPLPALKPWNPNYMATEFRDTIYTGARNQLFSDKIITNGLYFPRDTYIGRGMLSQLLRTMSLQPKEGFLTPSNTARATFFGQPFVTNWEEMSSIERDLDSVVLDFNRRFQSIHESFRVQDVSNLRNELIASSELSACLLALENMTVLLMERLAVSSPAERISFLSIFKFKVIDALASLLETMHIKSHHPQMSTFLLWARWALVTWYILASYELHDGQDSVNSTASSLLHQLLSTGSSGLWTQLTASLNRLQASPGVIHGQDVLEIWVCLIQVLSRYGELHGSSGGFWSLFNKSVRDIWLKDEGSVEKDGTIVEVTSWQDRGNNVMGLLQDVCRLHQFERDGSSNATIRTTENWELIIFLLQKGWLEHMPAESTETERDLRRLLQFCHSRINTWGWTPCADIVVFVYRYFAGRGFRDMPTEHGYRLPEFLKQMITATTLDRRGAEVQEMDDPQVGQPAESGPNMAFVETMDEYDRCFEVFLKILAKTIHWQIKSIYADGEFTDTLQTSSASAAFQTNGSLSNQGTSSQALSRIEKMRACKRLLSSVSPAIVTTISSSGSSEQTYSSLCNPCNLVLVVALLVPDSIRPSNIGQLKSLLNFEGSDDASRRIMLESIFYLGTAWQRQDKHSAIAGNGGRSPKKILDYYFERLEFLCQAFEEDLAVTDAGTSYVSRSKRRAPVAALIETALSYVGRLLSNEQDLDIGGSPYPPLAYLDQRLSRFFHPDKAYPPELRLQALGIVESFLALRGSHIVHLQHVMTKAAKSKVQEVVAAEGMNTSQNYTNTSMDDEFSSLEFDQFVFDDMDLLDPSPPSDVKAPEPGKPTIVPATATSIPPRDIPVVLPQDEDLAKTILSWIYPSLEKLIKARQQALHDKQQQQTRSTIPGNLAQQQIGPTGYLATMQIAGRRNTASSGDPTAVVVSNLASMSLQGAERILSIYADCSVILLDHRRIKMGDITSPFKREAWLGPWIQHWRLQDELVWAMRVTETSPGIVLAYEDMFLGVWFSTVSIPVHELTVQHRFLKAILSIVDSAAVDAVSAQGPVLCRNLFKDLPIAHLDYNCTGVKDVLSRSGELNVDRSLVDTNQNAKLFQEFKESRLQLLAKVLSNIGEHYMAVRPTPGSADPKAYYQAHSVKSRYQTYLGLLLNQIKRDYERLELRRMVRENITHVDLAHHVVGHVIQHCGDGVYIHQKIRGYAYLYQAGEKQFFQDLLQMIINLLRIIPGKTSLRFDWLSQNRVHARPAVPGAGLRALSKDGEESSAYFGLRVMDAGSIIYEYFDQDKEAPTTTLTKQLALEVANERFLPASRSPTATIPQLFSIQPGSNGSTTKGQSTDSISTTARVPPSTLTTPPSRSSVQTLFGNQLDKQKDTFDHCKEALRTLTSSLRNVALEAEDRKQWNTVMGSFRTMVFISIFRPLLTAFLGPDSQQGYCSTLVPTDAGAEHGHTMARARPQRPSLMVISVPVIQWLVSLIAALSSDISSLSAGAPTWTPSVASIPAGSFEDNSMTQALEGFQKETSMLFSSLLQSLAGSFDLVNDLWMERTRRRLGDLNAQGDDMDYAQDDSRDSVRALYLFGHVLQAIEAIVKVARKIQREHVAFCKL